MLLRRQSIHGKTSEKRNRGEEFDVVHTMRCFQEGMGPWKMRFLYTARIPSGCNRNSLCTPSRNHHGWCHNQTHSFCWSSSPFFKRAQPPRCPAPHSKWTRLNLNWENNARPLFPTWMKHTPTPCDSVVDWFLSILQRQILFSEKWYWFCDGYDDI